MMKRYRWITAWSLGCLPVAPRSERCAPRLRSDPCSHDRRLCGDGPTRCRDLQRSARRAALLADWNAAQRELELFAADALVDQHLNASLREAQAALRFLASRVITVEDQREIIVQLVDKVVVNLETGDFLIHVHTSIPQLRELAGRMGQKIRGSLPGNVFPRSD